MRIPRIYGSVEEAEQFLENSGSVVALQLSKLNTPLNYPQALRSVLHPITAQWYRLFLLYEKVFSQGCHSATQRLNASQSFKYIVTKTNVLFCQISAGFQPSMELVDATNQSALLLHYKNIVPAQKKRLPLEEEIVINDGVLFCCFHSSVKVFYVLLVGKFSFYRH